MKRNHAKRREADASQQHASRANGQRLDSDDRHRRVASDDRHRRGGGERRGGGDDDDGADALSVERFCRRHGISIAFFYKLKALGQRPATMKIGTRTLISREAAARWRAEREAAAEMPP